MPNVEADKSIEPRECPPPSGGHADSTQAGILADLIDRIRQGDAQALGELFDHTIVQLRTRARAILRNDLDVEDVIGAVYERAWMRASTYDPRRGCVMAWLLAMCRSRAIDLLRRGRRYRAICARFAADASQSGLSDAAISHYLCTGASELRHALALLSPVRKRILAMIYFNGCTHAQIAASLDLPIGTVKSHLRRSLSVLREHLGVVAENSRPARRRCTASAIPANL